jgi:precorrin-4 methylase
MKLDALIESLHAEIARLKTLIPDDDSCKSCDLLYSEVVSLRNIHASILEKLTAEKEKNDNYVCVVDNPTCDDCDILELKLQDANARVDQRKIIFQNMRFFLVQIVINKRNILSVS